MLVQNPAVRQKTWVANVMDGNSKSWEVDTQENKGMELIEVLTKLSEIVQAVQEQSNATARTLDKLADMMATSGPGPAQKATPETVEAKWPNHHDFLTRLTGVTSTQQLPEIWHALAKAPTHEAVRTVQTMLVREAYEMNLDYAFVVSARLVESLLRFKFALNGNVETGTNIFNSVVLQEHWKAKSIDEFNQTDDWLKEGAVATLDVLKTHGKSKQAVFPKTEKMFRQFVLGYLVVLRVLLGKNHPLTRVYTSMTSQLGTIERGLLQPHFRHPYESFLWGIHTRMDQYFRRMDLLPKNTGEELPDFQTLINNCVFDGFLPTLPWRTAPDGPSKREYYTGAGRPERADAITGRPKRVRTPLGKAVQNLDLMDSNKVVQGKTKELLPAVGTPQRHEDGTEPARRTEGAQRWRDSTTSPAGRESTDPCRPALPDSTSLRNPVLGSSANTIGELVALATESYRKHGWHTTARLFRSDDAAPDIDKLPHPAAPMLQRIMKNGAPVVVQSEPWTSSLLDERAARGCHASAKEHKEFLMEEFLDFGRKGFWILLPYDEIKHEPGLRVSPIGCVPQDNRRPRMISDYSFWGLNEETAKMAPEGAMQFGTAPLRMREDLARANPTHGPVHMYKNDMSDGFYRIRLSSSGSLKLAVSLPEFPGLPQLVALPVVLPMGWTESPPWFCAFTETIADLTNVDLHRNKRVPPHHLGPQAAITDFEVKDAGPARKIPISHKPLIYARPLREVEVFVDDFIGMGQDHPSNPLENQRAVLSHNIDKVFRRNGPTDHQWRKEPQSQSKMAKGDASWHTKKEALGWDWGASTRTLQMTKKRVGKALTLLDAVLLCKRVSIKRWQQVIGVLRSLQPGMAGSDGHFSLLQNALATPVGGRIRLTPDIKEQLAIFHDFLHGHLRRPTTLEELVPGVDIHLGACDAAKQGRGGVWFTDDGASIVWRAPYSDAVQREVISDSNPKGALTNSDLELEGTVLHHYVLGKTAKVDGETSYTACDNTPAVAWRTKGSSTTRKARARLLRLAAGLRREQRAHHRIGHLSGNDNRMADDASRLWHLSDHDFLAYFNSAYPQTSSWKLLLLPSEVNSLMTSLLLNKESKVESALQELQTLTPYWHQEQPSAWASTSTQASRTSPLHSFSPSCSVSSPATTNSLPVKTRSELARRKMPCVRWARRFPYWGCSPTSRPLV